MNNKFLGSLIAGALSATLAFASPVLARGGGGGMGGGGGGMGGGGASIGGGGMGGGGKGGGGMGGGGKGGGGMGGGMHAGSMGGGPGFSGSHFGGSPFAAHAAISPRFSRPGFSPQSSRFAFRDGFHDRFARDRFFDHRFHRFAFGAPFAYAAYDSCWRRVWTRDGLRTVNVCGDYGY